MKIEKIIIGILGGVVLPTVFIIYGYIRVGLEEKVAALETSNKALEKELWAKDSLMLNIEDSFPDKSYKACINFKGIYFKTK